MSSSGVGRLLWTDLARKNWTCFLRPIRGRDLIAFSLHSSFCVVYSAPGPGNCTHSAHCVELFWRRTAAVDRFSPNKLDVLPPPHPSSRFDSFLASFQLLCGLLCPRTRKLHPQRSQHRRQPPRGAPCARHRGERRVPVSSRPRRGAVGPFSTSFRPPGTSAFPSLAIHESSSFHTHLRPTPPARPALDGVLILRSVARSVLPPSPVSLSTLVSSARLFPLS